MRLERLSSLHTDIRNSLTSDRYGSGVLDKEALAAIAKLVESELGSVQRNDERIDEISWHLKALAASGDMSYMSVIDKGIASAIRKISGHAKEAKETLLQT